MFADAEDITSVNSALVEFRGHNAPVVAADWLTGGTQIVSASWDRTAIIYDAEKGEPLSTLTGKK